MSHDESPFGSKEEAAAESLLQLRIVAEEIKGGEGLPVNGQMITDAIQLLRKDIEQQHEDLNEQYVMTAHSVIASMNFLRRVWSGLQAQDVIFAFYGATAMLADELGMLKEE